MTGLSTQQRDQLIARSDAAGLGQLAMHLGTLAVSTALILARVPLWPVAMVMQGILINFLFTAMHETVHRTPFKTRWLNDLVGRGCGVIVLIAFTWFRHFHLAHHRYTNDPENDPEIATPRPATRLQYVAYMSGLPDWIGRTKALVRNAVVANRDAFVPDRAKTAVRREALLQLGFYTLLLVGSALLASPVLLFVWILPLLLGGPFLRAYLLAEHAGCPDTASMFENTRTTFTTAAVRLVTWNMPFHAEHHAFPAVPFHQLPAFHEFTKAHLQSTADGYLRFNQRYLRDSG